MLPNPSMSFSPFAILTAEEMNDIVENINFLGNGPGLASGIFDSTLTTRTISGLSFRPNIVEFRFIASSGQTGAVYIGWGFMTASAQNAIADFVSGSSQRRINDTNRCLAMTNGSATFVAAQRSRLNDDGFSINFISTGGITDRWQWIARQ